MPPIQRNSDADLILDFWPELARRPFLRRGPISRWIPYVFHLTSLENAVRIMECGRLYSRSRMDELGILHQESADLDVIDATPPWVQDYVRFYFRPRTPTQFHMEGIRPVDQRSRGANCPVPVFFLFESTDILTRLDTRFSDGNLAALNPNIGDSCEELGDFPFEEIYHTGYYDTDRHPRRTYHRNAEVIVPREVDIDHASGIYCRSAAEKQTLVNSLPGDLQDR